MRSRSSVRRITIVETSPQGTVSTVVYRRSKKRRKQSPYLRGWGKVMRRTAEAERDFAQSYLSRHVRSNREERDGWFYDYPRNVLKASRRGWKRVYR